MYVFFNTTSLNRCTIYVQIRLNFCNSKLIEAWTIFWQMMLGRKLLEIQHSLLHHATIIISYQASLAGVNIFNSIKMKDLEEQLSCILPLLCNIKLWFSHSSGLFLCTAFLNAFNFRAELLYYCLITWHEFIIDKAFPVKKKTSSPCLINSCSAFFFGQSNLSPSTATWLHLGFNIIAINPWLIYSYYSFHEFSSILTWSSSPWLMLTVFSFWSSVNNVVWILQWCNTC